MKMSRRRFLQTGLSGLTYFSSAATVPAWIANSTQAYASTVPDDRILVIFQQAGGNDGLNTVIPYTDPKYLEIGGAAIRPTLHITSGLGPTELGDGLNAFHPKLVRLKNWYSNGDVAVVQNVGYPNPNLSHFTATDFFELGTSPSGVTSSQGWASRFYDNQCNGAPPPQIEALEMMMAGTSDLPLTLSGSNNYIPPAARDFNSFNFQLPPSPATFGPHIENYIGLVNGLTVPGGSTLDFVQRSANVAQASVADMELASLVPDINPYPNGKLGRGLDMVSKIIRSQSPNFKTKVFYVTQGGYDTHANQSDGNDPAQGGVHPQLLDEMDEALDAFMGDMYSSGNRNRVVLMTFSEFGRRPQENGSDGTDHGTANCLFVMGNSVNGGVYGGQPDLNDLLAGNQGGNLKHAIDFRSVYSVILNDWLSVDPSLIFGADYVNPAFDIQGGMGQLPIINPNPPGAMPSQSSNTIAMGTALTALTGAAALAYMRSRENSAPYEVRTEESESTSNE
jgi:uncharacterized protein (DUF1501 family)